MAGTPQTISQIVNVLNEVNVKKGVFKLFDEGTFSLDIIEKGDQGSPKLVEMLAEVDGRFVKIQAHTDGNPNVGVGVAENFGYPTPGSQEYNALKYRCQRLISTMAETSEVMSRSATDMQAVFRVSAREMKQIIENTRKRLNLYMLRDGSGMICDVASTGNNWDNTAKTLTLDATRTRHLKVGMEIIFRAKTTGAVPTLSTAWLTTGGVAIPMKITAKTSTTITLTWYDGSAIANTTLTAFNSHGLYLWDQQGKVPWGLDIACGTANPSNHGFNPATTLPTDSVGMSRGFGGIDRNSATWWQANATKDLGGSPVSIVNDIEPLELQLVERDSTLRNSDAVMCISDGTRWYQVIHGLETAKRTFTRTKIKEGRYEVVQSGIFTFGWDPDMTAGDMLFFSPKYFFRMLLTEWRFENLGGSTYTQLTDPLGRLKGVWQQNLESEQQLICASVQGNSKFTNVGS